MQDLSIRIASRAAKAMRSLCFKCYEELGLAHDDIDDDDDDVFIENMIV